MPTIQEIDLPSSADDAQWQAFFALLNRDNRDNIGGPQWDQDPHSALVQWRAARFSHSRRWLAHVDGEPVGCALAWWETRDDPDMVLPYAYVRPEYRGRGVGTALVERMEAELAGFGRALAGINTHSPGADPLLGPGGVGAVDRSHPGVRFALARGFRLAQASLWSRYDVHGAAVDPAAKLREAAAVAGPDHEVVAWEGLASEELLEGLAGLKQRMRADMPAGAVEFGESAWDVERVRQNDESRVLGYRLWRVVVRHRPSGALVALNELQQPVAQPEAFVGQWDTVVLPAHRGRRLGMLVKAANILQVRGAVAPGVEVNTCNAAENVHMLAINEELGFRPYLWAGSFLRDLGPGEVGQDLAG